MIDDCNVNNLAKTQVSALFNSRAIRRTLHTAAEPAVRAAVKN